MRCKKCNYYIMNETTKFCPECGESTNLTEDNRRKDDDNDDEEGGFFDIMGNVLGKLFRG